MTTGVLSFLAIVAVLVISATYVLRNLFVRTIVRDTEAVLLYKSGAFDRQLETGAYWITPFSDQIERIDIRPRQRVLSGQEILTKDRIAIKISLVLDYRPEDARKVMEGAVYSDGSLEEAARLALRAEVADLTLDEILEARSDLGDRIAKTLSERATELGFALEGVAVRDIMLPGNLKRAYSGVLEAQKDAERRLEQARGDHAVMRSLANTARLLDGNPSLAQARVLQALETGGNTIMFGAGDAVAGPRSKDDKGSG